MALQEDTLIALLDELKKLEREHGLEEGFNFFDAVDMGTREIKHTRFLSYMLRPTGPHGLGDQFLRAFLDDVMQVARDAPITRLELLLADLSYAEVYAEQDHFDITIWLPAQQLLIVVENKIRARESEGQLFKYGEKVKLNYPERHFLGVFLTKDGYEGEDDSWTCISYDKIYAQLRTLQADPSLTTTPDVRIALQHYAQLLRNEVVTDPKLIAACKALYTKHRAAIELVITHGRTSPVQEGARRFLKGHPDLEITSSRGTSNRVDFVCKPLEHLNGFDIATQEWGGDSPVHLWYEWQDERRLRMYLEVGPFTPTSATARPQIVKSLRTAFGSTTEKRVSPTYSRIWRQEEKLEDPDVDSVAEAMQTLWNRFEGAGGIAKIVATVTPHLPVAAPAASGSPESLPTRPTQD